MRNYLDRPLVMPAERHSPTPVEFRWEAFVAAKAQAERTGAIADGIAAGRAWAAFLAAFVK
jgi:hypothetical protein